MVWTATWTMLVSPLAMAQESKRVSKQEMQKVVDQLGLNKQITLGEFYKKNKELFPARIQKQIEPLFTNFKNQIMPSFEVVASKNTMGEDIATIRVSDGSELLSIQWFGEAERMLKFQNTNLSEIDVINFDDMFKRIIAGDEKIRKQIEQNSVKQTFRFNPNTKYPDVTKAEWQTMSSQDKANYIVNLRSLWQDAREVLKAKSPQKKAPKTSQNFFEKNIYFYTLLIGQEAAAAGKTVVTGQTTGNYFSGKTCIVAGYVARYEKTERGEICNHKVAEQVYNNPDNGLYIKAKEYCSAKSEGMIACNPYVYGTPGGAPSCVTPSADSQFQKATHWDGPCDTSSRLQTSKNEIEILTKKDISQGRYEDGNLKSEEERKKLFKDEQGQNFKLTEDYLLGILKFRETIKSDVKSLFDSGVLSDEVYNQIQLDKKAFDKEIAEAQNSCKAESAASKAKPGVYEKNYWQACDQLHRRFTFISELFESKCDGKKLNPGTLKCTCDTPPPIAAVPASSPAPAVVAPTTTRPADVAPPPPLVVAVQRPNPVEAVPPAVSTAPTVNPAPPTRLDVLLGRKPEVVPGASCIAVIHAPVVTPAVVPSDAPVVVTPKPEDDGDCDAKGGKITAGKCLCENGKPPKKDITDVANGSESWSCGLSVDKKDDKKEECGVICKMLNGIKKYAVPAIVTGFAVYAAYKGIQMLAPKKPILNPAADKCPDGSIPPCGQVCAAPLKKQSNGTCSCDGCPPGQTANAITCVCATGTPTGQTFLCPDSTTRVADLANCPTYACWNGQRYQNPLNCPPQPPVAPANPRTRN